MSITGILHASPSLRQDVSNLCEFTARAKSTQLWSMAAASLHFLCIVAPRDGFMDTTFASELVTSLTTTVGSVDALAAAEKDHSSFVSSICLSLELSLPIVRFG